MFLCEKGDKACKLISLFDWQKMTALRDYFDTHVRNVFGKFTRVTDGQNLVIFAPDYLRGAADPMQPFFQGRIKQARLPSNTRKRERALIGLVKIANWVEIGKLLLSVLLIKVEILNALFRRPKENICLLYTSDAADE